MSLGTRNFFPALQRNVSPTTSGSQLVSYSSDLGTGDPIVVLIHGYPQSAFMYAYPTIHPALRNFDLNIPTY